MKKQEVSKVKNIIQQEYEKKLLKTCQRKSDTITKFLKRYLQNDFYSMYSKISDGRKYLINPIIIPNEIYIKEWQQKEYVRKEIDDSIPEIYTERGERVRSKSEKILADKLYKEGIPYKYECPLKLSGGRTIYPDFTVLNVRERKELYWEHCGMMDQEDYAERFVKRNELYIQNKIFQGEKLIYTFETSDSVISTKIIDAIINEYLR